MNNTGTIRVGIGGWVFPPWRGAFYPAGLRQAEELAFASRHVTGIEINGTFYRIQTPASFRKWHDETPDDFAFSLKGPRFLTHRNELASAAPYIDRFLDSGLLELKEKLGPILWQFAPIEAVRRSRSFRLPRPPAPRARRQKTASRRRGPAPQLPMPGIHRPPAPARHRGRDGRRRKPPGIRRPHRRFRLSPPAPLRRRRTRRLPTRRPRPLGRAPPRLVHEGRDCFLYFINGAKIRAPAAAQALIPRLG